MAIRVFTHPPLLDDLVVTSSFGSMEPNRQRPHNGVDLKAEDGSPLFAVGRGVIVEDDAIAEPGDSDGIHLVLQLDNGYRVGYAHLSLSSVSVGQRVKSGQVLGLSGGTGRVTGPHLHLTLTTPAGVKIDPMAHMPTSAGLLRPLAIAAAAAGVAGAAWLALRPRKGR